MRKNVAGQFVCAEIVSATDGSAFTGTVTVYVTGNAGTQAIGSVGSGVCTHEGNGQHSYAPAQAETNYDHVAFTFIGTGAVPATVQVYTTFPQTGDVYPVVDTEVAAIKTKTDNIPDASWFSDAAIDLGGIAGKTNQLTFTTASRVDSQVFGIQAGVIAAATFAANALDAVWSTTARLLTAGTNIVLAKGTGVTGFNDLSAAQVNTEADTALADVGVTTTVTGRIDAAVSSRSSHSAADVWGVATRTLTAFSFAVDVSATALAAIWDRATSALTTVGSIGKLLVDRIDAAISSRMATFTYTAPLDAAGTRTAVGLASANLDTQLDALPTNAELATALGTADDAVLAAVAALNNLSQANIRTAVGLATANLDTQLDGLPTANENAAAMLDLAAGVETGLTLRQALRLLVAANSGKLSGAATTTIVIRNVADDKNRITATVDASGNRSAVVYDLT